MKGKVKLRANMDTEIEEALLRILAGGTADSVESQTLDFKQDRGGDIGKDVAEAAVCFANARGGHVVVGVADRQTGQAALTGTQANADELRRRVYQLTTPHVTVEASEVLFSGARLLVLWVPSGLEVHADPQGRSKWRIGRDCEPMTPTEIARLRDERSGVDWSAELTGSRTTDASPLAIEAARRRLSASAAPAQRLLAALPTGDLLVALGVAERSGRLRRAGELLFINPAQGPLLTYQYRRTVGGEPKQVQRFTEPLLLVFEASLNAVAARRESTLVTLRSGQQITLDDFPELAVRETIANALIHRDYRVQGAVEIEHSPQQLSVVSPGPLVSGVTPENILTTPSRPRSKCLAAACRTLGMAEETGRGVDRIYQELIRAGKDVPRIEDSGLAVRVTLAGGPPKANIARAVAQLPVDEREDTDTLLVLFSLCAKKTINAAEFHATVQRPVEETERMMRRLATAPALLIEPTRETARRAHPSYRLRSEVLKELGDAVPYHRRTRDDIDQRVINHVAEYKTITNRAVQNLFEVSLVRARNIIADLVRRELLVKVSDHQRGPGVEYGPGSSFPKVPRRRPRQAEKPRA